MLEKRLRCEQANREAILAAFNQGMGTDSVCPNSNAAPEVLAEADKSFALALEQVFEESLQHEDFDSDAAANEALYESGLEAMRRALR